MASLRERPQYSAVVLVDHSKQHKRWSVRFSVATLPVPQRAETDAELRCELFLREPNSLAQGLHVDFRGLVDLYSLCLALLVRNSFAQALSDAVKCFAHIIHPMPFNKNLHQFRAGVAVSGADDDAQCLGGGDDADVPVRLEHAQVVIAGDDEIGRRGEGAGDDGLIVGIAELRGGDYTRRDECRELSVARKQIRRSKAGLV